MPLRIQLVIFFHRDVNKAFWCRAQLCNQKAQYSNGESCRFDEEVVLIEQHNGLIASRTKPAEREV
ncbi:MAG: hypothetical protein JWQ96_3123 [Segetibacter sp.]|nr:hypothetical protein [Segetibacter sp.]